MFQFSSIEQYHAQLQSGTLTCETVVQHYLQIINANIHLNAFVEVYAEEAINKAKALDISRKNNTITPFHGVIVGIKDVICYKDHKITAASNILKKTNESGQNQDFISLYSATAIQKLTDADAIIIGNLNCDEFAMGSTNENSCYGKVLNALDETRVPGGSSGGSAVAVQAGMCMVSLEVIRVVQLGSRQIFAELLVSNLLTVAFQDMV